MKKSNSKKRTIWTDAETLTPEDLAATKIHVSLRIDPNLYRKVLAEQRRVKDRTVTAAIERILKSNLDDPKPAGYQKVLTALRNLLAHSVLQDEIISAVAESDAVKANIQKLLTEGKKLRAQSEQLDALARSFGEERLSG